MSHFSVLVITPEGTQRDRVEVEVGRLLAPYDENGECFKDGSRWDWWTVGGHWTGCLGDDYNPEADPANIVTCEWCDGTGKRTDMEVVAGCNACRGKGQRVKWATEWAPYDGDIRLCRDVRLGCQIWAVVLPDGSWHENAQMGWWGAQMEDDKTTKDQWQTKIARWLEEYGDNFVALVDCHV